MLAGPNAGLTVPVNESENGDRIGDDLHRSSYADLGSHCRAEPSKRLT
jgi:hypothetical protein